MKQIDGETFLPDEIIEKIISKLPIKSLLRFKSVRKQWLSLISHPNFVQSHLNHILFLQSHHQKIMAISSDCSQFCLLNHDGRSTLLHQFNLPLSPSAPDRVHLLGSCNGLFCLGIFSKYKSKYNNFDVSYNPILWNPLLNDYKKVPFNVSNIVNWFGFGYDSHTEDYKLVRVKPDVAEAEVYSLKSSSIRRVPVQLPVSSSLHEQFGMFFNGSLYWITFDDSFDGSSVPEFIVFDLRYEKFRFIKFLNNTLPDEEVNLTIVRDCDSDCDCIGVFFCDPENKEYFNLVTMKENSGNGGSISWSMIKIQPPEGNLCWPICFMMNGEILVRLNNKFRSPKNRQNDLFMYNSQQRTTKKIEIHGDKRWSKYTTYIETLVLPSKLIAPSACLLD